MLNEKYVQEAIEFPIEGLKLSERLYDKHLMDMKYRVKGAVTQVLINSSGYAAIAKTISDIGFTNFNHAMTIAITEEEAVSKGVDLQKKWLSTLDKKTRHSHQKLDGQTVPIDGEFEINGHRAPQPRLFGIAKEDIRCRCDTITIVEGIDPSLRRDNETGEITNFKNYTEWKQDKINKIGKEKYEIEEKKVRNTSSDKKQYARYKEILGKKVPKTLEGFQELKYNNINEWNTLKQNYKDINNYNKILSEASNLNIKGTPISNIDRIDLKDYEFDYQHINNERAHGVTKDMAQEFINNSKAAYSRWNGQVVVYVSENGCSVINIKDKKVSTSYKSSEYDDKFKKLMEVLKYD